MATKTYKWEGTGTRLPDGHRIFETHDGPDGVGWAICDDTGEWPEESDDGILWLDSTKCISAGRHQIVLPLLSESGKPASTIIDAQTMLYLSRMLRWTIEDDHHGRYYNVR